MNYTYSALFFIVLLVFSSIFVNGLVLPSVLGQRMSEICDHCGVLVYEQDKMSPLKQFKHGVPTEDTDCNSEFVLLSKKSDNSPACVKPDTAKKLVERGWGTIKEHLIWFESIPIQCQETPWEQYLLKQLPRNTSSVFYTPPMTEIISSYFKSQGITIFDAKKLLLPDETPLPLSCSANPVKTYYYFLVSYSDADKMISLGYKEVDSIPSNTHLIG